MDRLETRELAYFVAVAEELHFARAAQRLGIAQPPLSRAIKQFERRIGVTLLERNSRHVGLTPAGEVLLHESRKALDAVAAAGRRAQRAGQPDPRLILVMKPGGDAGLLPDILAAYGCEPDAVAVDVFLCGIGEQATRLRQGHADLGLLHRPHDDLSGFDTEELLVERQVVVLPTRHRLAGRAYAWPTCAASRCFAGRSPPPRAAHPRTTAHQPTRGYPSRTSHPAPWCRMPRS